MTQALRLVLLRHGQSEWNAGGIFTGWENASLTATGEEEATRAGLLLATHGLLPAFAHTSLQHRTIRTAELALAAADCDWIPGPPVLAAQRAALRSTPGPPQGPGAAGVRRTPVHRVAPVL